MSVDFSLPTYQSGSATNLAMNISPLGLVELSDEEFEVNGPRLSRYAIQWSFYLGRHWSYQRELGESQVTFNYFRALSDYLITFVFGRGVQFKSPRETEAIVPSRLKRIWEVDNDKPSVLWEMAQQGSVSGDCFVKVAYEEAYTDPAGRMHPGRVRLLALNSSHCFPEWHPHDQNRFLRFKLKYRFWGSSPEGTRQVYCVDDQTEALTRDGWKKHYDLSVEDDVLGIDPVSKEIRWQPIESMHRFDYDGEMVQWRNSHGFDALTTPNHRWLTAHRTRDGVSDWDRPGVFKLTSELAGSNKQIITGGGTPQCFASTPTHSDEFVELLGWAVTEGHYQKPPAKTGVLIAQSESANPEKVERLRRLVKHFSSQGATATEQNHSFDSGRRDFYFGKGIGNLIRAAAPDRHLPPEFLCSLTEPQARLLYETLLDADGHRSVLRSHDGYTRTISTETFIQNAGPLVDDFQMLSAMLGRRSKNRVHQEPCTETTVYSGPYTTARRLTDESVHYQGIVWCPKTSTQTWLARRNGGTFWTGNTYTEILTNESIEEYINDELIDQRKNPLGVIPIVHIANQKASGSPFGLADCFDMISLNREYNEMATLAADILNYHSSPVTVILGAKASNLEKGAKKVWAIPTAGADVKNLELNGGPEGVLEYMEVLKRGMHEMTGVPETALGQVQPISNTSGVALSIQFQPLMQRWHAKVNQYAKGLEKINEYALLTLFWKEPETLLWNPETDNTPLSDDMSPELDPADPLTYRTFSHFPPPLPIDKLILLNEIQMMMSLNLESRKGALAVLGEEFPEAKLEEIRDELMQDAKADGALQLLKAQVQKEIADLTGIMMGPDGGELPPMMDGPPDAVGNTTPQPQTPSPVNPLDVQVLDPAAILEQNEEQSIRQQLVEGAYGTKLPKRQSPSEQNQGED